MTKGMRLLIMVFILMAVVFGMMQCATKAMHKKKAHPQEDGRMPIPMIYLASASAGSRSVLHGPGSDSRERGVWSLRSKLRSDEPFGS